MKNIDQIIKNVLNESIRDRSSKLTRKILEMVEGEVCEQCGSELQEGECMECGSMKEEVFEEDLSSACESYKYHLNNFGEDDERTIEFQNKCESSKESSDDELEEELHGGQHKLDVAEPKGKLTSADFKKLRSKKGKKSEENENWGAIARAAIPMAASYIGSKMGENNEEELDEYSLGDEPTQWDNDEWERRYPGSTKKSNVHTPKAEDVPLNKRRGGDIEDIDYEEVKPSFLKRMVNKFKNMEEEVEEGNAFTGALAKTKKGEKFKLGNKTYTDRSNLDENIKLTESEIVDLIESIVLEQKEKKKLDKKTPKGYTEFEKNVKKSKKENDDYIKSVTKKMKEYLKDGSKDDFSFEPKHFPKGNGQLEKMKKKAYVPSEAVEEYIEEFAYSPGMENLQYDEIKPNDEWIEMNLEGSSKTGNSSEYANAEKTDLGKKINEKRKKNLYGIEKRKNSYNRVKQPVDSAGEGKGEKSIKNMFKKLEENTDTKQTKVLNEEFEKITGLMTYNRKTQ